MLKSLRQSKGFTIIEVMIVLAIAGMIILVVLLAVPAVQRSGRNTAIKNDASAIAGGITEYESTNDGAAPTAISGTGTVNITGAGTATSAKVQGTTVVALSANNAAVPAASPAVGTITIVTGHKCTVAGVFTPGTIGDVAARSFAIYYSLESSGANTQKCLET